MQANNLFLWQKADQLEFSGLFLLLLGGKTVDGQLRTIALLAINRDLHIVVHGGELGVVDLDLVLTIPLDSLWLSQASGADFGMGEDYGRDPFVVEV